MSTLLGTLLAFDPTGTAVANKVLNEIHSPKYSTNPDIGVEFRFIIPLHGLFYRNNFAIKRIRGGVESAPLTLGTDYNFALKHIELSKLLQVNIYGAIVLTSVQAGDSFKITVYQAVGDYFVGADGLQQYFFNNVRTTLTGSANDTAEHRYLNLIEEVANKVYNPRMLSWEYVADKPVTYPTGLDLTSLDVDATNLSTLVTAIQSLTTTLAATLSGNTANHILDHNNPHSVTKAQVGLELLNNLSMLASMSEFNAMSGASPDKYISAKLLKTLYDNLIAAQNALTTSLNTALTNHTHDKNDVGLGQLIDWPLALTAADAWSATAGDNKYVSGTAIKEIIGNTTQAIYEALNQSYRMQRRISGLSADADYQDLNTLVAPGVYEFHTARTDAGYPTNAGRGFVEVMSNQKNYVSWTGSSKVIIQRLYLTPEYPDHKSTYKRFIVNDVPSPWSTGAGDPWQRDHVLIVGDSAAGYKSAYDTGSDYRGSNNLVIGDGNLSTTTSDDFSYNIVVGMGSFSNPVSITSGMNVVFGASILTLANPGMVTKNVAVGIAAMAESASVVENVAIGYGAGALLKSSTNTTLVGSNAGTSLNGSNYSTYVGGYTGQDPSTGTTHDFKDYQVIISDGAGNIEIEIDHGTVKKFGTFNLNSVPDHIAAYDPHPAYTPVWKSGIQYAPGSVVVSAKDYNFYRFLGADYGDPYFNYVSLFLKKPKCMMKTRVIDADSVYNYTYDYSSKNVLLSANANTSLGYGYGQVWRDQPAIASTRIWIRPTENGKVYIGGDSFTFETKIKLTEYPAAAAYPLGSDSGYGWIYGRATTSSIVFAFLVSHTGHLVLRIGAAIFEVPVYVLALDRRYTVAFTKDLSSGDPVYRIFLDGVLVYTVASSLPFDNATIAEAGGVYSLFNVQENYYNLTMNDYYLRAELHEVRLTVGHCRYTADYGLPSRVYPEQYGLSTQAGGGTTDPRDDPAFWEVISQCNVRTGSIHHFPLLSVPNGYIPINWDHVTVADYPRLVSVLWVGAKTNHLSDMFFRFNNSSDPDGSRDPNGIYMQLLPGDYERAFVLRNRNDYNASTERDAQRSLLSVQADSNKLHSHNSQYGMRTPGSIDYNSGGADANGLAWGEIAEVGTDRHYPTTPEGDTEAKMYNLAVQFAWKT